MAKPIVLTYAGETSSLEPARLDRKKLYGHRRRLPMDPAGSPCTRAALTEDGSLLVRAGMTAQGYLDDEGNWVPNQELVGLDAEGQPLPLVPSTLGAERPLEGPVDASEVLDCAVDTVYALSELELSPLLRAALDEGQIFRFEFNYRADYSASRAYLVANDEGALFALIGKEAASQWLTLERPAEAFEDDESDDDDLDFEMF